MSQAEDRLLRLRETLKNAVDIAQNKSLQPEDLKKIKELWTEQERFLEDATNRKGGDPTMQEMLLDLKVIDKTGAYLGQYIRQLQANATAFNPSEYADKLLAQLVMNDEVDWNRLADIALPIIDRGPGMNVLLGTFTPTNLEIPIVERKRKLVKSVKEELVQMSVPDQVETVEKDDDSVDAKVTFVLKALNKYYNRNGEQPVSFYKFVLHPTNFTTSVENIFYISFIIRDGLASLKMVNDELVISPREKPATAEQETQITKHQMVFSITMDDWQMLIREHNIHEPVIKWKTNLSVES